MIIFFFLLLFDVVFFEIHIVLDEYGVGAHVIDHIDTTSNKFINKIVKN